MKVRTKLIIGFSAIVVLLWLIAINAGNNLSNLNTQFAAVEKEIIPGILALNKVEKAANDAFTESINYRANGDDAAKEAALLYLEQLQEIEVQHPPYATSEQDRLEAARIMEEKITDFSLFVVEMLNSEIQETGPGFPLSGDGSSETIPIHALQQEIDERRVQYDEMLKEVTTDFDNVYKSSVYSLFLSAGLITLIAITTAVLTTRSIVRPLLALRKGTEMIARGDLDYRVGTRANDEIGQLSRDFDRMTQSLSTSMTSIDNLNEEIAERKRMEKALADEATRRRILVEQSRDGIVILDQNGGVYEANRRFAEMIGYSQEETLELHVWDWEYKLPPEQVKEMIRNITEEGDHFETCHRRKDGTTYDVEISTNGATFAGQKLIFCVCRDITERKQAEELIREREKRFSDIAENALEWIWEVDTRGKYTYSSPVVEKILGYKPEEILKKHFYDFFLPEEREELKKAAFEAFKQKQPFTEFINKNRCKNGKTVELMTSGVPVLDEKGNLLGYRGVDTDVTERKKAEEALKTSEERFRLIADNSTDLISRIQTGPPIRTDYVSPSCLRITGYKQEDFYTDPNLGLEMIHPDDRELFVKIVDPNKKSRQKPITVRLVRKDGQIVWIEQTHTFIYNEHGEPMAIHLIAHDITERLRSEKALKESEEKFSKAFRASPEAISISSLKDSTFIDVNDSYIESTGYAREELLGKSASDFNMFVDPKQRDKIVGNIQKRVGIHNEEFQFRMKSGEIRTKLISTEFIKVGDEPCVLVVGTDITERKRADKALKESEEKFAIAFRSSPQQIIITRIKDGITLDINDSFTRNSGFTREETVGHSTQELNIWANLKDQERFLRLLKKQGRIYNEEFEFLKKSGEKQTELLSAELVIIGGEECLLSILTDITERKQGEAELKRALTELEESSARLVATNKELEAFSYSVSHDLRSPLRSIDGFSQALLEDYEEKLDETGQDYLKRLRAASQKMGELIDGMLKLSRLTRGKMHLETVDLSTLAEEIAGRLQETHPQRRGKFIIEKGLSARGDPELLRVLLENLLGNAWKFTRNKPEAKIEFSLDHNGGRNSYFIRDNGAGFDMTYSDKLFGAFQRLHDTNDFPGTGIGLATVKRIINRHGGTIRAEGEVGKGATFYFTLN